MDWALLSLLIGITVILSMAQVKIERCIIHKLCISSAGRLQTIGFQNQEHDLKSQPQHLQTW